MGLVIEFDVTGKVAQGERDIKTYKSLSQEEIDNKLDVWRAEISRNIQGIFVNKLEDFDVQIRVVETEDGNGGN